MNREQSIESSADLRSTPTPAVDLPLSEAIRDMSGWEILAAQQRFGEPFERLGGIKTLIAAVWSYRNRTAKTTWTAVEQMTLRELEEFFAPEDPAGPLGDQGKEL